MSRVNPGDPQMEQGSHVPRHHSTFPMGNNQFITCRFGEYVPFFAFDSYEKDKVRQRSITTTRSLSLKAPLMEDINLKRDYFQVYYDALLPVNWDKCYVRPKRGDIVDWQKCSTNVASFPSKVSAMCRSLWQSLSFGQDMDFRSIMRVLVFIEMFYSNGSLINHFGAHMSPILKSSSNLLLVLVLVPRLRKILILSLIISVYGFCMLFPIVLLLILFLIRLQASFIR